MDSINTLTLAHKCARERVQPGDLCIDATAGRGQDTAFLCELVGPTGRVLSFDIQEEAIQCTRDRLRERGLDGIGTVIMDSHSNMDLYAKPDSVDLIVFNFGYLPGGNKQVFTLADTSVEAITKGVDLLKKSGIMCLSLYFGGPNGYSERDAILELVKTFDPKICTVIVCDFANRKSDSPFPIFIIKGAY